ncbi:hypothetical protein NTJ56_25670 [Burkholderia contaminans]|uniref:hypothetical protein n=1 Tax=Burkholderia contaminans TaxID=488447 RepID=UPI001CF1D2C0|nr:hypothetical protein [Burkholderia contaminans]MCA7914095.1 hypothetical protein [Burkholderia contaminans]MCA8099736.1 hypothetical protein [Burkholderia contaminans]UUX39108.1 hypothetical protein NTJ56_25670 [Burkholderia contaminans]
MNFLEKGVAASPIGQRAHIVEHVGSDNQKQTYYAATSMWLKLEKLQIVQQLVEPLDMGNQPTLSTSLHGVASIEGQELSILGDTQGSTRTLQVTFEARDVTTADRLGLRALEDELGTSLSDVALGSARLGFNRADDEVDEPDQWWLACHIPDACLQVLAKASSDGQLGAVELGLTMRHLYLAERPTAAPVRQSRLFLKPDDSDDTIEWPTIATGYVTGLRIDFATTSLRGTEQGVDRENNGTTKVVADSMASLGLKLANLNVTVRWLGALIVVLLFLEFLERL